MNVNLVQATPNAEEQIVEIARVSSARKDKKAESHRLIKYLINHKHWSPFEHATLTVEIDTSRGIAAQILRHRSFTFQEFSQRYQDVTKIDDDIFEEVELRKQATDNRQSSTEVIDPEIPNYASTHPDILIKASKEIENHHKRCKALYQDLIEAGVAREVARFVLPLSVKTKMYMTGSIRSWIHFLELRDDEHAQKEIQLIAKEIKNIFVEQFPDISKALGYKKQIVNPTRKVYVKLTDNQRKALKKDGKKLSLDELADKYGVTTRTVRNILK